MQHQKLSVVKTFALLLTANLLLAQETVPEVLPQVIEQELKSRGMTAQEAVMKAAQLGIDLSNPQQAAARARQLGLPESQIQQLLGQIQEGETEGETAPPEELPVESEEAVDLTEDATARTRATTGPRIPYFGYNLFTDIPDSFEPSAIGPVNDAYRIGFGDELRLTVWGAAEFQYDLRVDREGRIYIPKVGQTTVAGKRLDNLRKELRLWLSRSIDGLTTDPPTVFMDLTLTRMRPIKIFVLGEVPQPGGYIVANSSTIFNALYSIGGPLTSGSLREISLIREGKKVATIDLYDYLLRGYSDQEVRLAENDHLFIPLRGKTVTLAGTVKRPAIYELQTGETLKDLLSFAGGLLPQAYTKRAQIQRIIPFPERENPSIAREVIDLEFEPLLIGKQTVQLHDGDVVRILSTLNLQSNAVYIFGAVKQPGQYEISKGMHLKDLLEAADGLFSGAFPGKADILRLHPDLSTTLITVDLRVVMANRLPDNMLLQPEDRVRIYSIDQLRVNEFVSIQGRVKQPGTYPLHIGMTAADLIFLAGGFLEGTHRARAEVSRQPEEDAPREIKAQIENISLVTHADDTLGMDFPPDSPARQYLLRHRDILTVFADPQFSPQEQVKVEGEVLFPGWYSLHSENETLTSIIRRAGGILPTGYAEGGLLTRGGRRIVTDIADAVNGKSKADVIMLGGDIIRIPPQPNMVLVEGNVGLQGLIKFWPNQRVNYYLDKAGNLNPDTEAIYLTQANGAMLRLKRRFFLFRENPIVEDGATILVTRKEEIKPEDRTDLKEILGESMALLTSVLTVLLLTRYL